jgi:hypothetical protein
MCALSWYRIVVDGQQMLRGSIEFELHDRAASVVCLNGAIIDHDSDEVATVRLARGRRGASLEGTLVNDNVSHRVRCIEAP